MSATVETFPLTTRRMTLADVEQVHELDVISFSLPWPERSFRYELTANPAARMWVAEMPILGGSLRVVGTLGLWLIIDEVHIGTLAVAPEYRKRGIAQKLLVTALAQACKEGARSAYLEVRNGNLAAKKLYEKFGFAQTGIRPRYYSDNSEDALLMTLNPMNAADLEKMGKS